MASMRSNSVVLKILNGTPCILLRHLIQRVKAYKTRLTNDVWSYMKE